MEDCIKVDEAAGSIYCIYRVVTLVFMTEVFVLFFFAIFVAHGVALAVVWEFSVRIILVPTRFQKG